MKDEQDRVFINNFRNEYERLLDNKCNTLENNSILIVIDWGPWTQAFYDEEIVGGKHWDPTCSAWVEFETCLFNIVYKNAQKLFQYCTENNIPILYKNYLTYQTQYLTFKNNKVVARDLPLELSWDDPLPPNQKPMEGAYWRDDVDFKKYKNIYVMGADYTACATMCRPYAYLPLQHRGHDVTLINNCSLETSSLYLEYDWNRKDYDERGMPWDPKKGWRGREYFGPDGSLLGFHECDKPKFMSPTIENLPEIGSFLKNYCKKYDIKYINFNA